MEKERYLQLTLVRHGETEANKDKIIQGQMDTVLSEHGRQQSSLVGQRLASAETISHIFSSDLARAMQTAELIRHELTNQVEFTMDTRLRERAFGELEGRPLSEIIAAAKRAEVSVREYTPSGGESPAAVDNRLASFMTDLFSAFSEMSLSEPIPLREGGLLSPSLPPPHWHVLLVSHGGALHAICEQLRKLPGCQLPHRGSSTPNTAITSFLLALDGHRCLSAHTLTAHNTQHFPLS